MRPDPAESGADRYRERSVNHAKFPFRERSPTTSRGENDGAFNTDSNGNQVHEDTGAKTHAGTMHEIAADPTEEITESVEINEERNMWKRQKLLGDDANSLEFN